MKRRTFITSAAALIAVPSLSQAAIHYKPGMVKQLLSEGKTVFIDYTTEWCTTCAAQKRTLAALLGDNAAYGENITFVTIDYDIYGRADLATELKIPRRSTLVALKGDQELGRIVAGTGRAQIQGLLDAALEASQQS
ncbi:MAG: thioredoxin family protein [Planktomarina sp.]